MVPEIVLKSSLKRYLNRPWNHPCVLGLGRRLWLKLVAQSRGLWCKTETWFSLILTPPCKIYRQQAKYPGFLLFFWMYQGWHGHDNLAQTHPYGVLNEEREWLTGRKACCPRYQVKRGVWLSWTKLGINGGLPRLTHSKRFCFNPTIGCVAAKHELKGCQPSQNGKYFDRNCFSSQPRSWSW